MEGKGQPQPAAWPRHERGTVSSSSNNSTSTPAHQPGQPAAYLSSCLLHQMFSTCVARGIAAKLVYKTVGGKVETSLYCSTAASGSQKKRRTRPDNERRKMKREAWLQRKTVSQPDNVSAATAAAETAAATAEATAAATATASATAAAATAATALEEVVLSTE